MEDNGASSLGIEPIQDSKPWSNTVAERFKGVDEQVQQSYAATDNAQAEQNSTAAQMASWPPVAPSMGQNQAQGQPQPQGLAQLLQSMATKQPPALQPGQAPFAYNHSMPPW